MFDNSQIQKLVDDGYDFARLGALQVVDERTPFGTTLDWDQPTDNLALRHPQQFAISLTPNYLVGDPEEHPTWERLLDLGGSTQTIRMGRTLTRVFRLDNFQRISFGEIQTGKLIGCRIQGPWMAVGSKTFDDGMLVTASYVDGFTTDIRPMPDALKAELARIGFFYEEAY